MDTARADPGPVPALDAWLRPPLIPWQALRQLQETQREIEELRRGGTQTGSSCPEERASHIWRKLWGRAESFIASMQRELPSLERPRWLPLVPRASARVVASVQVADTQAPIRIRHDAGANSNTPPEPEPEPDPRLAPTGNNRSKLHFHTMPGTWAMGCWGAAPEGYCWCALWTRHTVSIRTAVRIQSHLPLHDMDQGHCDLPVARMFVAPRVGSNIRAHRSLVEDICFKPFIKSAPFLCRTLDSLWQPDVNTRYPCFVIETDDNPLRCRYRCIDGKHRIHRLLAAGVHTVSCHVFTLEEIEPFVIGIPLCLLPPLPAVGSGDLAEEENVQCSNANGARRYMRSLGIDVAGPT